MRNQKYMWRRIAFRTMLAMTVIVGMSACKDDYALDDEKPEWLGNSVWDELDRRGNYTQYMRLMKEIDMSEVLKRTGSRTVFATPDEKFDEFFAANAKLPASNPWHTATSFENLSLSQKKLLANCSMLNNAITMETLSAQGTGNGTVELGVYLRRPTLVSIADSATYMLSEDLPTTYNESWNGVQDSSDVDFWKQLKDNYQGIYLSDGDGSQNMMLCFTREQMAKRNITDADFALVMGKERAPKDVFIYNAKIANQDITCQNGYINELDGVIRPLPNMAEALRISGMTSIFSHMLDRFSIPVYISKNDAVYKNVHQDFKDKNLNLYTKWYISQKSGYNPPLANGFYTVPISSEATYDVPQPTVRLKFDPAWNEYSSISYPGAMLDMACMFVPTDEVLRGAFCDETGALRDLVEEYAKPEYIDALSEVTLDNLVPLYRAIDQIPKDKIILIINHLMAESYNNYTKSKFKTLMDGAEPVFGQSGHCDTDSTIIANNGVIYLTNSLYAPTEFVSVAAPAYTRKTNQVMKYAIESGKDSGKTDYLYGLNYFAYLNALSSKFTLFLPSDEAMKYVYDPMTMGSPKAIRVIEMAINDNITTSTPDPLKCQPYIYNPETLTKDKKYSTTMKVTAQDAGGILYDLLQTHTLVHSRSESLISDKAIAGVPVDERDQYYVSKRYDPVKVTYKADGTIDYVQGGFQIENENRIASGAVTVAESEVSPGALKCAVSASRTLQNGDTYTIDAPIIPATKTVYQILEEHEEFSEFLKLCITSSNMKKILTATEMYNDYKSPTKPLSANDKERLSNFFSVFNTSKRSLGNSVYFFNQYEYTVFVPTNEAILDAKSKGLVYDWTDIEADYEQCEKVKKGLDEMIAKPEDAERLRAKIKMLINFVRLHFMDKSVFADNSRWEDNMPIKDNKYNFPTECFYQTPDDPLGGSFIKLHITRPGKGELKVQALKPSADALYGEAANVMRTVTNGVPLYNMMAREFTVVAGSKEQTNIQNQAVNFFTGKRIGSTSGAVVHLIDKCLQYAPAVDLTNPSAVRKYLEHSLVKDNTEHK